LAQSQLREIQHEADRQEAVGKHADRVMHLCTTSSLERPAAGPPFREAARLYHVFIIVRRTNLMSLQHIGDSAYVPKRLDCKAKTADSNYTHPKYGMIQSAGLVVDPTIAGLTAFKSLWKYHDALKEWGKFSASMIDPAVAKFEGQRALTYVPIYILGFSETAMFVYVAWVVIQATFIHANVRWRFRAIRWLLATPSFHHWHHSAAPEAVNKNFAVHLPALDWLFGSYYLPDQWPASYGLLDNSNMPAEYVGQLVYPFRHGR